MDFALMWYWDVGVLWTQEFRSREKYGNLGVMSEMEITWKFLTGNCFEWMLARVRGSLLRGFCCFGVHTSSSMCR